MKTERHHPRRSAEKSAAEMRQDMEFLRSIYERRQRERQAIDATIGRFHPVIKAAFWVSAAIPAIAATIYLLTK
jgi:hypothetical protein